MAKAARTKGNAQAAPESDEGLFGLFDGNDAGELFPTEGAVSALSIVRFKAETVETCQDWQTLFRGFSSLKVITYSSSIPMLQKVLKLFADVEVIFGNEAVLGNLEEILRNQYAAVSVLQNADKKVHGEILNRIQNGTLAFYVTKLNDYTSHQKLYLLSDGRGKYRVITGSANFTRHAFESSQLENILVSDDFTTYDLFYRIYQKTRALSTMQLTDKTLKLTQLAEIEELPAIKEIVHAKKLVLEEPGAADSYALKKEEFDRFVKERGIDINRDMVSKSGTVHLVTYEKMKKVSGQFRLAAEERKKNFVQYPTLRVDKNDGNVYLNDEPLDLENIAEKDVQTDLDVFQAFFSGYDDPVIGFKGSLTNNVRKYFATVNYAFCAPFLSVCRYETAGTDVEVIPYPLALLLKGTTNGGKTMLLKFILKLCFNPYGLNIDYENGLLRKANTAGNGPAEVQNRRLFMQGMPIMIDEVTKTSWKGYGDRFIKTDVLEAENVSPVIMATNDIEDIEEALAKRTVAFSIDMTVPRISNLTRNAAIKNMNKATGALYREYLARMMERLPHFLSTFHSEEAKEAPDLLALSSRVLSGIFEERAAKRGMEVPSYVGVYNMNYYLISANNQEVIDSFIDTYTKIGDEWEVNRKADYIRIQFGNRWEAKNFQNKYGLELTEVQGRNIIMPLKKTEEYFGIEIGKRTWLDKVKSFL